MWIKGYESALIRCVRRSDRWRAGDTGRQGKGAADVKLHHSERIGELVDEVAHFLSSQIIKHTEAASKHSSPVRRLCDLVSNANSRSDVSVALVLKRRAYRLGRVTIGTDLAD